MIDRAMFDKVHNAVLAMAALDDEMRGTEDEIKFCAGFGWFADRDNGKKGSVHVYRGIDKLAGMIGTRVFNRKTKSCKYPEEKYFVHEGVEYFELIEGVQ